MKALSLCTPAVPSRFCATAQTLGSKVHSLHERASESSLGEMLLGTTVLVGIPDDRGVALNSGHAGAALGPSAFREAFFRLSDVSLRGVGSAGGTKLASALLWDAGDVSLVESIEETHERLAEVVSSLLRKGVRRVCVIGGGHDFSYGSYKGHAMASEGLLPVVNFDAHFDLRPVEEGRINSGTPFWRVLQNFADRLCGGKALLELGVQRDRNPASLHEFCNENKIPVVEYQALLASWKNARTGRDSSCLNHVIEHLDDCRALGWKRTQGSLHLSIDLDVFRSDIAPGTSASTPWGASLQECGPALCYLARLNHCRVIDIAELCPPRDHLNQTARLAAALVYQLFLLREETLPHE